MSLLKGFLSFLLTCLLVSCASVDDSSPYLFSRGKQRHDVFAYGPDGELNSSSSNYLVLGEETAQVTSVAAASMSMMKANLTKGHAPELLYLNPALEKQRPIVKELLKRLSKLLWTKRGSLPGDIRVLSTFEDGSVRDLEWIISKQKIVIHVEKI